RRQAVIGRAEALGAGHRRRVARRTRELAAQRIRPAVIRADERAAFALLALGDDRAAMAADRGVHTHGVRLVAHHQQRLADDLDVEETAGVRHLLGAADAQPILAKQSRDLALV